MKFSINTDFTKFPRAVSVLAAAEAGGARPDATASLAHDERHLRRKAILLDHGGSILVDLPEPVDLAEGDRLVLEDGRQVAIAAAPEDVYDVRARDAAHLAELAWHIGSRHLAASIAADRIAIARDPAVRAMLEGLGARVEEVTAPFSPLRDAFPDHGHDHDHHAHGDHGHDHDHHGEHRHGGKDRHGRRPGDPHYGHNHD